MPKLPSLSIFFPAYNEENNIEVLLNKVIEVAPRVAEVFEVIVVNDGSKDRTAEVVDNFSKKYQEIRLVSHVTNLGYGSALKTGFYSSRYEFITYMDSDGQFDFSDVTELISNIEDYDIVCGFRIKRADNFLRILNGKLWNLLVSSLLNIRIKDIDCGFKLVRKKVIDRIPKLESSGAAISAELLVKASRDGFKITQVGLNHSKRMYGRATGGNPIHILRAFADLLILVPKLNRTAAAAKNE